MVKIITVNKSMSWQIDNISALVKRINYGEIELKVTRFSFPLRLMFIVSTNFVIKLIRGLRSQSV